MNTTVDTAKPPSSLPLALELRGILELQAFFATYPLLQRAPRGDGHPVLVLPGLAASDGSPFANEPKASSAWHLYETLSGRRLDDWPDREGMKRPPPVPSTAIFSRTDGVVAWQGCLEQNSTTTENIEGSHSGLGHNPAALQATADRLALRGEWSPFDRAGFRCIQIPLRRH
jgi:hypothetical protein